MVCSLEGPGVEFKVRLMSRLSREHMHATIIFAVDLQAHAIQVHKYCTKWPFSKSEPVQNAIFYTHF